MDGGGAEVCVSCRGGIGKSPLVLDIQARGIHGKLGINSGGFAGRLHWAVIGPTGDWQAPTMQPDGSQECDAVASSAYLNKDGAVTMTFKSGHVPEKIAFVVVIQSGGQTHWLKASGDRNFEIDIAALAAEAGIGVPGTSNVANPPRVAPRAVPWTALESAREVALNSVAVATPVADTKTRRRRFQPLARTATVPTTKAGDWAVKQGSSTVQDDLGTVLWHVVKSKESVEVFIEASLELVDEAQVILHWGRASIAGSEWEPFQKVIEGATAFDAVALRTPLEGQARTVFNFTKDEAPQWLSFVLFIKVGSAELWVKTASGANFWIDVLASPDEASVANTGIKETLSEKFVNSETKYSHWTQFQRFCLASDTLAGSPLGKEEAAWVATSLCLADAKVLEWYRNSGYQPKDMAHAQERIGGVMATAHKDAKDPLVRTLLRLCVKAVPRGNSSGGDSIRHGILNIMRTHGIKEGHRPGIECKFIEQWHQKLHTNSAPDDIAICEGYLAFLASGNPDDMWRVIWEVGKLTREDLGKMCSMGFADHTKSGAKGLNFVPRHLPHMYDDVKKYLGLLRHVHGGSDLFTLCEACKGQYPDHGAECLAFEIFNGRDDPMSIGKILELRRKLEPSLWKRDVLMLDVSLEDLLRSLAERSDIGAMRQEDLLNLLSLLVKDLMLSRHDPSLQQAFEFLERLVHGDRGGKDAWSVEWCKMVHAACDRIALNCSSTADKVVEALQHCADALKQASSRPGVVFKPDEKALASFGEEKARCLTERVVAQMMKALMPKLRRAAGLGPWEVVSQGQGNQAVGRVVAFASLPAELASGQAPVVAVVETMTGWEDIPGGITAILLPAGQAVDTLSHVAIRARNQQVLLASCDEESFLKELRSFAGRCLRVEVGPSGDVTWTEAALTGHEASSDVSAKNVMQKIALPPPPPAPVLLSESFVKNSKSLGGKSLHLAELKPQASVYEVPLSFTVPYGMFEKALAIPANEGIKEDLDELVAAGRLSEARKFLVDELEVPEEITRELSSALSKVNAKLSGDWTRALKGVWASKWTDRAVSSRKQMNVPDDILFLAVLVQPIVPAAYAFVIHTKSPLPGAKDGEQLVELCVGLGESLVSNSPGRALSATVNAQGAIHIHVYPSKPEGVFAPEGGTLIFRSDSNGEDLEGFAGAGLYDSITVEACQHRCLSYAQEPLIFDIDFREKLLKRLYDLGRAVETNFAGAPQDIEGAVHPDGRIVVTQSRPQV